MERMKQLTKEQEKIKKYLEKKFNIWEEEILLCCEKQGGIIQMRDFPILTGILVDFAKEELEKTNSFTQKEREKAIKKIGTIRKLIKISELIPNIVWDKIEKVIIEDD